MNKVKYNLCPSYISDIFNISDRSYNLRNSGNFTIPKINTTTYGKHSIRYNGPVINMVQIKYTWLRVHSLRTSLELTLVRTVTCLTLRIINEAGRVSEFVYFSFFDFLFFWGSYGSQVGIWHVDKVFIVSNIISRIQHPLIVRREKLILLCKIFALRHPNNCVFSVCES